MKEKQVKITFGSFPHEHRIVIEGKDVTHLVKKVEICADANVCPSVIVHFVGYNVQTEILGKINLEVKQFIDSINDQNSDGL